MKIELLLKTIAQSSCLEPKNIIKKRVYQRFLRITRYDTLLSYIDTLLPIPTYTKNRAWKRVSAALHSNQEVSLEKISTFLSPSHQTKMALWHRIQTELLPSTEHFLSKARLRWLAAFTAVAFIGTISPHFLFAPTILAEAEVVLHTVTGETAVLSQGMYTPIANGTVLQAGMTIQTLPNSESTIVIRDDGVLRLSPNTVVVINDIQDVSQTAPELIPSFTVVSGTVWLQGLIPSDLRGISVELPQGFVTVHEGSVSAEVLPLETIVTVWDRAVKVHHHGNQITVISGGRATITTDVIATDTIPLVQYSEPFAKNNLSRDAMHRKYIAHLQAERLSAVAGTLPTSTLYPVKRLAEKVDILLTFNSEDRVKKQVVQAQNRLSEAAALLSTGTNDTLVQESLSEYKSALQAILDESGGSTLSQLLVAQNINDAKASMSALKPTDEEYIIKKTVLLASRELPTDLIENTDDTITMLTETLDTITEEIEVGNFTTLEAEWPTLQVWLKDISAPDSKYTEEQKAAYALLEKIAIQVREAPENTGINTETVTALAEYAPIEEIETTEPVTVAIAKKTSPITENPSILTDNQVERIAAHAYKRIYAYNMPRSRQNQLREELKVILDSPDKDRIIRALLNELPDQSSLRTELRLQLRHLR